MLGQALETSNQILTLPDENTRVKPKLEKSSNPCKIRVKRDA